MNKIKNIIMNKKKLIISIIPIYIGVILFLHLSLLMISGGFSLVGLNKITEDSLFSKCSNYRLNPLHLFNEIEVCPNGDIYIGRRASSIDGRTQVFNKDYYLILEEGGWNRKKTITPIYLWRVLTFQEVGCKRNESVNYCTFN